MNNVEIENISFSYAPGKPILNGLDLVVKPNEIVGLLGANGSGKTTTFKLLSGLLYPDEGSIKVAGISVLEDLRSALKKCAYVPDESLLYPHFSALENMNLFSILWGVESHLAKDRSQMLLKEVGLWEVRNQWVRSYSKGMKQKLALCTALLHEPKVLLMDEPFTGLDINAIIWARNVLKEFISQDGRSIIFTSHTPEVVETLAHRVIILKDGKVVYDEFLNNVITSSARLIDIYQNVMLNSKKNEHAIPVLH